MPTFTTELIRLSSAIAELHIRATPVEAGSELRGRLMGPRVPGAETIEVAYPLKAMPGDEGCACARVIIPEPNLWAPDTPYVYSGPVEVWCDGRKVCETRIEVGLKPR